MASDGVTSSGTKGVRTIRAQLVIGWSAALDALTSAVIAEEFGIQLANAVVESSLRGTRKDEKGELCECSTEDMYLADCHAGLG